MLLARIENERSAGGQNQPTDYLIERTHVNMRENV